MIRRLARNFTKGSPKNTKPVYLLGLKIPAVSLTTIVSRRNFHWNVDCRVTSPKSRVVGVVQQARSGAIRDTKDLAQVAACPCESGTFSSESLDA